MKMKNKRQKTESYTSGLLEEILDKITEKEQLEIDRKMMLAARIYDGMKGKGWKQQQLAEVLGKTEAEISRLLSGTQNPSAITLWQLVML